MILTICPNPSIDTYAWVGSLEPGTVNRINRLEEYPGGKATHIAMALKELGEDTRLLGIWAGCNGDWIKQKCLEKGIPSAGIAIHGNSRKCYTFRSQHVDIDNTELLEPGPMLSKQHFAMFLDVCVNHFQESEIICMAGSWPQGTADIAYASVVELANINNKRIIIDCSGAQLRNVLKHRFFGIHLNESEAMSLGMGSLEQCLTTLSQKIELVVITKGRKGLWLAYNGRVIHARAEVDNVISTVGSGDCLTAGVAYAVSRGWEAAEVARYAVACGAANCMNEKIGQIKRKDVEALLPLVEIKVLAHEF